jgi:pilus assembly protein FimV
MIQRQLFRLSSAILLAAMLNCAQAVELGDSLVRSHIGRPLSADIELTGIASETATVQVGLADPDVYRGASIAMHPALASLNITITRRAGKRFLHIVSPKVVESEYVHIFFDLVENGQHSVRQTTLWFTPDPNPAPPPVKVAQAPAPAPAVVPAAAPAKAAAAAAPPRAPAPVAAALAAPVAAALAAPVLRAPLAAQPVACVPKFTAAQIGACTALDAKNAALTAQIADLEEKVRVLSAAMHAKAAPVVAKRPVSKAPSTPLVPMGAAPVKKAAGPMPWLFIGIAGLIMLALAGLLAFLSRRKRAGRKVKTVVGVNPGFIAGVKNRLMPAKKQPAPEPEQEAAADTQPMAA